MKNIIELGMKKYFQARILKYEIWKRNALGTQDFILFDLLAKARFTEFGKKYQFDKIQSYDDFRKNIPVFSYEDIFPYIEKMLRGESDVLWPGFISFFSKSSGTTNDVSKYIPVSYDSLNYNNFAGGREIFTIFFKHYPESNLFKNHGCTLSLGGSISEPNKYGIQVGDVSAVIMTQLPKWAQMYREPSIEVATLSAWQEKIPAIIRDIQGKNITSLSGVPTWFISLFEEMKKSTSAKDMRSLLPNVELFIHGAVAFDPYRPLFKDLFPSKNMKYLEVYNASEGFFAVQDDPDLTNEMLLLTDHGVFYEFIPMKHYGEKNMHLHSLSLSDVQLGVDYALIITTNAGLWRYDIGDTIQFTSLNPYRIKISGRTKHFINVFGEELMVGNTDQALAELCREEAVSIENYTAAPIFMNKEGKGGHEWIIEFKKAPSNISVFQKKLDERLQLINSDYKAKRQDDIALQELVLHVAPTGTFMKWMASRGKLGGQNKDPRLSNKRKHVEQILELF